jgi:hypothetical protein
MSERFNCRTDGSTIRCECGGEVVKNGNLYRLPGTTTGVAYTTAKVPHRVVVGYSGWCSICGCDGDFLLPAAQVNKTEARRARARRNRAARAAALDSVGARVVRGSLGGTYYE